MAAQKKIGIITMHRINNYGSVLQAFALQYIIEKMGFDVQLIDYNYPNIFQYTRGVALPKNDWKAKVIKGMSWLHPYNRYDYKFQEEEAMPEDYLNELTNEELYNCLKQIDYQDALKIGKNNRKRLLRAIYIYNTHNKNKTDLNNEGKNELLYKNVTFIGLNYPREILYERINKRVDEMIANGLKEEVTKISKDFTKVNQALQAIGYKEFFLGLNDEDTIDLIKKNTRNYAKRQLTFFKNQFDNIIWFDDLEEAFLYAKGIY